MISDTIHKKKKSIGAILLGLFILVGCGVQTEDPTHRSGTAGQPIYLSVQANHLQVNQTIEWHFTQVPEGVILTQYDFDPSPRSQQVVFTPPDTGVYKIMYTIKDMSGNPVLKKPFTLNVDRRADSGQAADTTHVDLSPTTSTARNGRANQQTREITPNIASDSDPDETASASAEEGVLQKIPGKYTVQVAARKSFSDAESMASRLKQQGYEAYIQRVQFPDTGEIWYRVRIGSYNSVTAARALKHRIADHSLLRNQDLWVDFQRKNQ